MKLKFSEIKTVKSFCENLFSDPDWRDVVQAILDSETDFTVDNVRFIDSETIDETLADELGSDEYLLGCFRARAISAATGWPIVLIEAAQKGGAFEEIGKGMLRDDIERLANYYSSVDGYGHHFNSYDHSKDELTIAGNTYLVFDNH